MKIFDDCFHDALHAEVPASNVKLFDEQLSYTMPQVQTTALEQQAEILRRIRQQSEEGEAAKDMHDALGDDFLSAAVLHNQPLCEGHREWIPLQEALVGPAHVAKLLIRRAQDKRSTTDRPYRLNGEQLACIALFVSALEKGFANREDVSKPFLKFSEVLMTIILDGGGGCGKTTLALDVLFPLLETFFGEKAVLRRAPSNKPARLIQGRTMHSSQGLTPQDSLRTHNLALKVQARQKLARTHVALFILYPLRKIYNEWSPTLTMLES